MRKFTKIEGLSSVRRLPRLGKIRLGVKVEGKSGKSYPKETPHFVVTEEVAKVYGNEPKELDIMIPVEQTEVVFPQAYEMYGSGKGLKCTGDGVTALRFDEESKSMRERECPCEYFEQGKCKQRAHLSVLLPRVSVGGIYQIDTSSYNSIVDLNSSLDYVRALVGRISMVPLKLKREARETHHDGHKQVHYTMRIELEGSVEFLNQLRENNKRILSGPSYVLPAPVQENPEFDDGQVIDEEEALQPAKTAEAVPDTGSPEKVAPAAPAAVPAPESEPSPVKLGETPAPNKEMLMDWIRKAENIDDINQVLDMARSLPEADRGSVKVAAMKRVPELRKTATM